MDQSKLDSPLGAASLDQASDPSESDFPLVPIPSLVTASPLYKSSPLTSLICDEQVISQLLEVLLKRAGLSIAGASRSMGCGANTISQYINKRRCRPSLLWFLKFAELCGARITIELPRQR
jgi:hypothetical protein